LPLLLECCAEIILNMQICDPLVAVVFVIAKAA